MTETKRPTVEVIVIFSDGIRGHVGQSRGVASWISRLTGAEILEVEVPALTGSARIRAKSASCKLPGGNRRDAREWLSIADGDAVVRRVGQWFSERGIREGAKNVLLISAGSTAAPYNLALAYIWRCSCATIMTPGVIGTEPFDFAIVPEHDHPDRKPNIFVTLGSPNNVTREELDAQADALLREHPPKGQKLWGILIGGDDANYSITPQWIRKNIGHIMRLADIEAVDLYITTSRRTSAAAVAALKTLAASSSSVRYLLIAAEDPFNPIPAMLGFSNEMFVTDDSVNMVSETVTGGHRVVLLRTERKRGVKSILQRVTALLVSVGAISQSMLWGVPKFDLVFDHFAQSNALIEFRDWTRQRHEKTTDNDEMEEFNEAKRAAQWIINNWQQQWYTTE